MKRRKLVPVEDLRIGMYLVGLDRSWMETPFLRHRMVLREERQIEKIRACGARYAEIESEERDDEGARQLVESVLNLPPTPSPQGSEPGIARPEAVPFEEEISRADEVYSAAKTALLEAVEDLRRGREVNLSAVATVVEDIVDSLVRNPEALPSLTRLKSHDEYTFSHSVNVGVLAVAFGRHQGFSAQGLLRLGTGALLHDIGKVKVPLAILNKPGRYTREEYEVMKRHPEDGADILFKTPGITDDEIHPALEHHERGDGTGYPFNKTLSKMNPFGLITQVVDVYDAMTSERVYHKERPPYEVLQYLYTRGQSGHFDFTTVQQFIQCVGIYPVGSLVELDTGETAIVMSLNRDGLLVPRVLVIEDLSGPLAPPYLELDLAEPSLQPKRTITAVVDHSSLSMNLDLADCLAKPQHRRFE